MSLLHPVTPMSLVTPQIVTTPLHLVSVVDVVVRHSRQHLWILLVLHVHDSEGVLVVAEADLPVLEPLVRPTIHYTLCVMHVTISSEAAGKLGVLGLFDVDHVETTGAGAGAHSVHEARFLVTHNVVGVAHLSIVGVGLELGRCAPRGRGGQVPEACQVEDLHAMVGGLTHNEGMIVEDLQN